VFYQYDVEKNILSMVTCLLKLFFNLDYSQQPTVTNLITKTNYYEQATYEREGGCMLSKKPAVGFNFVFFKFIKCPSQHLLI
jgi:hypothetical protein